MPDYRRYFVEGGTYFFTLADGRRWRLFVLCTWRDSCWGRMIA